MHNALNRQIYDKFNIVSSTLPGTLIRSEGGPLTGLADADRSYEYAGYVYEFFSSIHGRDSVDNAGLALKQTVRYCEPGSACPYGNAFWNGAQMVYGQGYASADDVVAHELTHGVTQYESNLFYYMQSGAINEAFSDIWGEIIDLSYAGTGGNDTPGVRWQIGEDLPIGAIRSMSNPGLFGDPDRMGSPSYRCVSDYSNPHDRGGVHHNSGVANKAAALMADGGVFNGFDVSGIGLVKTARIFYLAQIGMLGTASDYQDLYYSLAYSCSSQVGQNGITAADCLQVNKAIAAVQMNQQPSNCAAPDGAGLRRPGLFRRIQQLCRRLERNGRRLVDLGDLLQRLVAGRSQLRVDLAPQRLQRYSTAGAPAPPGVRRLRQRADRARLAAAAFDWLALEVGLPVRLHQQRQFLGLSDGGRDRHGHLRLDAVVGHRPV